MNILENLFYNIRHAIKKKPFNNYRKFVSTNGIWQIQDWQDREKKIHTSPSNTHFNWDTVHDVHKWVHNNIEYVNDIELWEKKDYWPTSEEVLKIKREDCDGQAIARWRLLIERGIPEELIGFVLIHAHMFCCLYTSNKDDDFYILDNGSICYGIHKASKVFTYYKHPLKYGFSLTKEWKYFAK